VQPPSSLALSHTFAARSLSHFLPLPRSLQGLDSLRRVFPSSARERTFPSSLSAATAMESNRFLFVAAAAAFQNTNTPMHSNWEREREKERDKGEEERENPNSPSFGCTRAIVCNSAREINRNSPLSRLLHCSHLHRCIPLPVRPPRLQIAIVIANQWKQNQKISRATVFVRIIDASLEFLRVTAIIQAREVRDNTGKRRARRKIRNKKFHYMLYLYYTFSS